MHATIDEQGDRREQCVDPTWHVSECPECRQPMGEVRYTSTWRWHNEYCSPECRDAAQADHKRHLRRQKRRYRRIAAQELEHAKTQRHVVVPREMLLCSGHKRWKGEGKPPKGATKLCGRWVKWFGKKGPVEASCSCSSICEGKIANPFKIGSELFVSMGGRAGFSVVKKVWKVVPAAEFEGPSWSYSEKLSIEKDEYGCGGEFARNDPNGFYHGMKAKWGKQAVVIQGPPVYLIAGDKSPKQPKQKSLFAAPKAKPKRTFVPGVRREKSPPPAAQLTMF